jgi:hypothetical protein
VGLQAAQAAHAAFQLSLTHLDAVRRWHERSNCLVLLTVPNEGVLLDELARLADMGVTHTPVFEPDIGDEHTAIAVAPSAYCKRFADLPLLGRGSPMRS